MAGLKLTNLSKSFGNVKVIKSVDLEIDNGEFVVFVGPSGCGKSTLLRIIAGLENISDGQVIIGDRDVTYMDPADRGVAMVFQSYALYPHMTVRENINFGMRINHVPKDIAEQKVQKAAKLLQLNEMLDRKPAQLSGGQRQRVAIGRAIVREPELFLFDEPLSNLDAELRVKMRIELLGLHAQLKTTMIYVTHDQVEAMTLADKIIVLRDGCIEQIGTPLRLYDDPDNLFVAGFIGSPKMNFFNATILDNSVIEINGFNSKLKLELKQELPQGSSVVIGARPEHFKTEGEFPIKIKINAVEQLGATTFAYSRLDDEEPIAVELREGRNVKVDENLTIYFDPELTFVFSAENGLRIR